MEERYIKELIEKQQLGVIWDLKDFSEHVKQSEDWIIENILKPFRDELDVKRGGCVKYPYTKGSPYKIAALRITRWVEENSVRILKRAENKSEG